MSNKNLKTNPYVKETKRILIVDDDKSVSELLERALTSFGFVCAVAEDGLQAVQHLKDEHFDLIIADIEMPNMNGLELLRHVRENHPDTDTIIATGFGAKYAYADIIGLGAADYLNKPIDPNELRAKINRLFRERIILESLQQQIKTKQVLSELLLLSASGTTLEDILDQFLQHVVSFTWLNLMPKGAVFLADKKNASLQMMAHHNLAEPIQQACALLPFGRCLCGRAALTGEVVFADGIDDRHENSYEGIAPHGHYCIPIKQDIELLGVFTVYTVEGAQRDTNVEKTLVAAAGEAAKLIRIFQIEKENRKKDFMHRAVTNNTIDAIIIMDQHGRISFWNPAAEKILGYTENEAMGRELHPLLVPDSMKESYQTGLNQFLNSGQGPCLNRTFETIGRHKNGTEIPIDLSVAPLQIDNEWHAIGIVRDITKRKQDERDKEQMQQVLSQSQRMEAIGTLAGGIAHDFNNLLATIIGFADLAKDEVDPDNQLFSDLSRILAAGQQAKGLIHQILAFSRETEHEITPLFPHLITKETVKLLRAAIPANIEINQDIDPFCGSIMAESSKLHQVIMNLCVNAGYALKKTGNELFIGLHKVEVDTPSAQDIAADLPPGKYVRLRVRDNGSGMDPLTRQKIFLPYFTTKPQGEGTGLGLATVYGIVKDMGGAITVKNSPGQGTTFDVYFPSIDQNAPLLTEEKIEKAVARTERILFVDDEPFLVEISTKGLTKKGYQVAGRTSSIEALEAFRARPENYDLVITDNAMPHMTGMELARKMIQIRPDIPIIMITGFGDLDATDEALKIGIRKFIFKPVITSEMDRVIREVLN